MRLITNRAEKDSGLVGKNIRRYLATTALTATGLIALMSPAAADNWGDHVATEGSISIDTTVPNTTNITQHTDFTKVQGDGDINAGWTVNLAQPSSSSKYVLYDIENDPTYIMGNLNANGQVYIFDQNGVIFGAGSQVNVGAIIASTGTIADADIKADRLKFVDVGGNGAAGNISLNGNISVAEAGLAAFVAPGVENNGIISAKMGKVALASGNTVTLDLYGDNLVEIAVDGKLENALVKNSGTIRAEGGTVALTAQAAKGAVDNVINMDGIVDVSSVTVKGGKIVLGGGAQGKVDVDGVLLASGEQGGGEIKVTGQNVEVSKDAIFAADAVTNGNGGTVLAIANQNMLFNGSVFARGGALGGNGGFVEVSGHDGLGYAGSVNTTAPNGVAGTFLLDPTFAIIHSGWLDPISWYDLIIRAENLADDMHRNGNVTVQATNTIEVGTDLPFFGNGDINLSYYNYQVLNTHGQPFKPWLWTYDTYTGGNNPGNLVLDSNTINFNKDLIMGSGNLTVKANTVNVDSKLYSSNNAGLTKTVLGDAKIFSNANTVNVISPDALIQQGVWLANDAGGATVNVGNGTYNENILVNKGLKLQSKNGRGSTTINGIAGAGALGTIVIGDGVNNVQVGDTGKGFTINGFDSANPAVENAAVYLQGTHDTITIKGNEIVANGDSALASEYGLANNKIVVDGNIISGKTYNGAWGAWGVGNQFEVANVPRQLVAFNQGLSNVTFSNNEVIGDSGNRQLVAIESNGSDIYGNNFDGQTNATILHVRGSNVKIHDNTFDGNGVATRGIHDQWYCGCGSTWNDRHWRWRKQRSGRRYRQRLHYQWFRQRKPCG